MITALIVSGGTAKKDTASGAGFQKRRDTNQGPYSMSKYAVLSLSEAPEHELEGTNVGVSVFCAGPVNTNIQHGARNRPEHMAGRKSGGFGRAGRDERSRPKESR